MSKASIKRMRWLMVTLTTVLVAGGCADSSPVTPGREPLVFTGRLTSNTTDSHSLPLLRSGTIRIELTELTAIFVQIDDSAPSLVLGVGIGVFDDKGLCIPTLQPIFGEGSSVTVLPSSDIDCLAVFDSGRLPEGSLVAYVVTVTDASES